MSRSITRMILSTAMVGVASVSSEVRAAAPAPQETAAEDTGAGASDVVVTARRRVQTAQSVPATLQVFDANKLAQSGIINTRDLQQETPSLAVAPAFRETFVALRGITNNVRSLGADPSVAVNFNGIYLPRTTMLLTELYDVGRIEVLKGPQGDLYGRNATGGAINILSQEPKAGLGIEGFAGIGSFNLRRIQGAVNIGNEVIAVRLSGAIAKDDGYTHNAFNGGGLDYTDFQSIRAEIRFKPSADLEVNAFWHHGVDKGSIGYTITADPAFGLIAAQYGYVGLAGPQNLRLSPRDVRINQPLDLGRTGDIAGLTASLDLGAITVKSITGYTRSRIHDSYDTDGTSATIEYTKSDQTYRSVSEEVQLLTRKSKLVDLVLGGYFYWDHGVDRYDNPFNDNIGTANPTVSYSSAADYARLSGRSVAGYGQVTLHLAPTFDIVAGARYTHDVKTGYSTIGNVVNVNQTVKFSKFTPSGELIWKPDPRLMIYASVSKGFKSGGLNFLDTSGVPAFRPENVTAYEAGIKSRPFGEASILNVSGFYYDYRDIQFRTSFFIDPNNPRVAVTNATSAKVWGVELQTENRIAGPLSFDANVAYLNTSVAGYVSPTNGALLNGRALPMSPKWSGAIGLRLDLPIAGAGHLRLRGEYAFRSTILFPYTFDAAADTINDPYSGLFNATARFTLKNEKIYFELIGRNLNNDLYRTFRANFPPYVAFDAFGAPRTIEGRIGFKF